jgi:hypothetical protein
VFIGIPIRLNTERYLTGTRAKIARKKQRLVEATAVSGEELKETAQGLAEVDTGYYRDHIRLELGGDGTSVRVGVRSQDFVGKVNPATGNTITFFYPLVLVRGSRHRIGNDIFTAALELRRARILGRWDAVLNG